MFIYTQNKGIIMFMVHILVSDFRFVEPED